MTVRGDSARVIVAHTAYRQRGGEDMVFESELALLRDRGHAVEVFMRHNDALDAIPAWRAAAGTLWSQQAAADLTRRIEGFKPDVIHVHNTFPLMSPAIYWAASRAGVPVVQTLHNFRLLCPQAMLLREGKVCETCVGRLPLAGVVRRCYRDSLPQSAVLAAMLGVHRALGTYRHKVSRYIALNEFCRRKFIDGGLPAHRIVVKPNFVDMPALQEGERSGILFVGRLSPEKGVATLVDAAAKLPGVALRVAGSGPETSRFDGVGGVRLLGAIDPSQVREEMLRARMLVLPSICYENFPRTLVEAFACGLPVVASRLGALAELIDDGVTGLLFEPTNADDLADKIRWTAMHPEKMGEMGRNARREYEAKYSAGTNYRKLVAIYEDAIRENRAAHA